ncbi:MAG: hypothetical protein HQ511_00585 [Rhodospirillales bacterium]|nr:hypothetical protein [Rhodospirillales bacterium]
MADLDRKASLIRGHYSAIHTVAAAGMKFETEQSDGGTGTQIFRERVARQCRRADSQMPGVRRRDEPGRAGHDRGARMAVRVQQTGE